MSPLSLAALVEGAADANQETERKLAVDEPKPTAEKPVIVITHDEAAVNAAGVRALATHPEVFQRGGRLVRVIKDANPLAGVIRSQNSPVITNIPLPLLREFLTQVASWAKLSKSGYAAPAHPPEFAVSAIYCRGDWPGVRRLEAVTESPVLRPDGTVLDVPGYDAATGLLYLPPGDKIAFRVPAEPTHADAVRARDALLEVAVDFPFESDAHRAGFLSGILTPLARFAFDGPAPLHAFDANVRGAGKTMAADSIGTIVAGRSMSKTASTQDDSEMEKRITAIALSGESLVMLDNIGDGLGTPALDAALTATSWSGRVLGRSEITKSPLFATWYASGNNLRVVGDTARRVLHIRLESSTDKPEERQGFKHPDLMAWVRQERPRLLAAALTLLRAYFVAGKPPQNLTPWGSFESWTALVRGSIVWAGGADPGTTRSKLISFADTDPDAHRSLLAGWELLDPERAGMTAAELLARLTPQSLLAGTAPSSSNPEERKRLEQTAAIQREARGRVENALRAICDLKPGEQLPNARRVGMALNKLRGLPCEKQALTCRTERGTNHWRVVDL